jgi:hypothetical protein
MTGNRFIGVLAGAALASVMISGAGMAAGVDAFGDPWKPSPSPGRYNAFPRFDVNASNSWVEWVPSYNGAMSVMFSAPDAAADLTKSEDVFVNAVSTNGKVSDTNAEVSPVYSVVPETATWVMLGLGFAGVGLFGFRRRKTARYAL